MSTCDIEEYCKKGKESCPSSCYVVCSSLCKSYYSANDQSHSISTNLIIMASVLGTAFILGICWILILNMYSKWKNSRRVNLNTTRVLSGTGEDFLDGNDNHRQLVEHHIWYINTVGLQQSVIDSINVIKFKKSEGLIDGTECSVCLSEFEEDETLRLLPKCNHAFHLPCIDTWLRSHKNCPLCRAPIVQESSPGELNSDDLSSVSGYGSDLLTEDNVSEIRSRSEQINETLVEIDRISEFSKTSTTSSHHVPRQEVQVRRSVSLDSSSASVIYRAGGNTEEHEVKSSSVRGVLPKCGSSTSRASIDEGSSVYRFMKRSMVMKKSLSSNGQSSVASKHKRSQTSILPF